MMKRHHSTLAPSVELALALWHFHMVLGIQPEPLYTVKVHILPDHEVDVFKSWKHLLFLLKESNQY